MHACSLLMKTITKALASKLVTSNIPALIGLAFLAGPYSEIVYWKLTCIRMGIVTYSGACPQLWLMFIHTGDHAVKY